MGGKKGNTKKRSALSKVQMESKREKQLQKAVKKQKKKTSPDDDGQDSSDNEEDIEMLLAALDRKEKGNKETACNTPATVSVCESQPSARLHCSFTVIPTGEVVLFGGEYFEGRTAKVCNDLYRWNVDRNEWRRVESPIKPKPRCSHQAVLYKDYIYMFGGEFATLKQFFHFQDLWRFSTKTNLWETVETSGHAPSARSGHRMVVWRNFLILFGGFFSTIRGSRYFNDLYFLSFHDFKWNKISFPPTATLPDPRSACLFIPSATGDYIFLYGGYAVEESSRNVTGKYRQDAWMLNMKPVIANKTNSPTWERLKKIGSYPSPRSGASMVAYKNLAIMFGGVMDQAVGELRLKSIFYNDMYAFDFNRKRWYAITLKPQKKKIDKLKDSTSSKRQVIPSSSLYKEEKEDEMTDLTKETNEFVDDPMDYMEYVENTFGYIDSNGVFVRIKVDMEEEEEGIPKLPYEVEGSEIPSSSDKEAFTRTEMDIHGDNTTMDEIRHSSPKDVPTKSISLPAFSIEVGPVKAPFSQESELREIITKCEVPLPRINANIIVRGNELYVYGGLLELKKEDVYLNDCWSFNLLKREGWECKILSYLNQTIVEFEEDASDPNDMSSIYSESDEDSDDESEGISEGESHSDVSSEDDEDFQHTVINDRNGSLYEQAQAKAPVVTKEKHRKQDSKVGAKYDILSLMQKLELNNTDITPQRGESLRQFFLRTKQHWMGEAQENNSGMRSKEQKRHAFQLSQERFNHLLPYLPELEKFENQQNSADVDLD
ncbi:kelch repeat-containing protein [Cardiosporidium cionae]|uniref:Kelch repeat-containing protein n=1 Tax=Cardiosporidium cionae TaxID=476202 RepID=A0ABQ7J4X4_9APIC|nr:kelch repeat-containing protein [Cardiosporidium cionae]|eukprot:KAF8819065.1 kelch repeat-containing protein [Cardiosporidium cionae]